MTTDSSTGSHSMVGRLTRVVVKRPAEAWRSHLRIGAQWKELGYRSPPDLEEAGAAHSRLVAILKKTGAEVLQLPTDDRTGMDSIYTHDPVFPTREGVIVLQPGKVARRGEAPAFADALAEWDVPVVGALEGEATAEAGDLLWLDARTLVAGRSFRTNRPGLEELSRLLAPMDVRVVPLALPYWNGPGEVFHLMSFISLLADDLALVYRRLAPIPLVEMLEERGIEIVDVPEDAYESLAANVLALAPRDLVTVHGNSVTRQRLEAAGCRVQEIDGSALCIPGSGGPTCLVRWLERE